MNLLGVSPKDHNDSDGSCPTSNKKIVYAEYIVCRTVQASSQRSGAQMFMAYRFGFTQYYETQHSCVLLYWVWCNLLAVSGVVPYALVLLKIDNLDVNELYLYYLIKLCKIPLVYCWWTCSLTSHNLALDYIICTSPTASQYLQSWFYILNFDDVVFKYYDFSSSICGRAFPGFTKYPQFLLQSVGAEEAALNFPGLFKLPTFHLGF